ncbi:MAG: Spy/CpxP family protein refolding chaperone [Pirellulales bacterium]
MKTWIRFVAVALVVALASTSLVAQEAKGKKKKGGDQTPQAIAQLQKKLDELGLSDEQKAKIKEIVAQHSPKVAEAQKKAGSVLSPEQRKVRQEAMAKAKSDGKKGKEAAEAVAAALNLSADDKAKLEAANKEAADAVAAMRKAVSDVLTDEQKAKAGLNAPVKGKKKKQA